MGVRLALLPNIKQFLLDYRELCPQSTVFSELHYLEEHIVKFVPKWKAGPGMMGEHGGEAFTISLICCGTASAASQKQHLDRTTRSKSII